MPITLLLLSILFVVLTTYFQNLNDKRTIMSTLFNLSLVLFGSALTTYYDDWKINVEKDEEREISVVLLQLETSKIHGAINSNLSKINQKFNIKTFQLNDLEPLNYLCSDAWNILKHKNSLFVKNTGDLMQIENLYTMVEIINRKIEFRENFIINNHGQPHFNEKILVIDLSLRSALEKIKEINNIVTDYLYNEFPYESKGYQFEMSQGVIIKRENKKEYQEPLEKGHN